MTDFMIVILILVAIIDFATGEKDAGIALLAVVVVNATIGFYQEFKANMALEALMSLNAPKVCVSNWWLGMCGLMQNVGHCDSRWESGNSELK